MFADLDETIRQLLLQWGNLDSGEVDIAFDQPTREWSSSISKPTVNLYLYSIQENKELRDPNAWYPSAGPTTPPSKPGPPSV